MTNVLPDLGSSVSETIPSVPDAQVIQSSSSWWHDIISDKCVFHYFGPSCAHNLYSPYFQAGFGLMASVTSI
jgi:hypothetical protein